MSPTALGALLSDLIETQRLLLGTSAWLEESGAIVLNLTFSVMNKGWHEDVFLSMHMVYASNIIVDSISYSLVSLVFTLLLLITFTWCASHLEWKLVIPMAWHCTCVCVIGGNALYWEMGQTLSKPKLFMLDGWPSERWTTVVGDKETLDTGAQWSNLWVAFGPWDESHWHVGWTTLINTTTTGKKRKKMKNNNQP